VRSVWADKHSNFSPHTGTKQGTLKKACLFWQCCAWTWTFASWIHKIHRIFQRANPKKNTAWELQCR